MASTKTNQQKANNPNQQPTTTPKTTKFLTNQNECETGETRKLSLHLRKAIQKPRLSQRLRQLVVRDVNAPTFAFNSTVQCIHHHLRKRSPSGYINSKCITCCLHAPSSEPSNPTHKVCVSKDIQALRLLRSAMGGTIVHSSKTTTLPPPSHAIIRQHVVMF